MLYVKRIKPPGRVPMIDQIGSIAQRLARNPLSIIALFIILVYGMVALVTTSSSLEPLHRLILVVFLVTFPIIVLFAFYALVTKHVEKPYGPTDYQNEDRFIEAIPRIQTEPELKKKAEESAKESFGIKTTLEDLIKQEATDSQFLSFQYGNRWDSGNMADYKRILEKVTSKNVKDTPDKLMAAVEILNYLEEVAIAVNQRLADEAIAKNLFEKSFVDAWQRLEDFIASKRSSTLNKDLYKNMEKIVKEWS